MNQPLVAFCIPTYNHGKYLHQCLDSILAQDWSNLEIWIGDDCSSDDSATVIERYLDRHPHINYHRNQRNLGTNANLKDLLRRPSAPYIARLDADDFIDANHTPVLMSLLAKYPKAGYAHSAVREVSAESAPLAVRKLMRPLTFHNSEKSLRGLAHGLKMCANMPIYRREALADIDFIAGAPFSGEDYYTACRMADVGWGNVYSRQVLGFYRVGLNSQWSIGRNIKRARGLDTVFEVLEEAYSRRHWTPDVIRKSRMDSALDLARNTFGRRGITPELEEEAQQALQRLWPQITDYKSYIQSHPPGWTEWRDTHLTKLKKAIKASLPI